MVLAISISYYFNGYFMLSLWGYLLLSVVCCLQRDVKAYIAYSSVVHMNFRLLFLILVRVNRKTSTTLILLLHGVVASLLFWGFSLFYYTRKNRAIYSLRGLSNNHFTQLTCILLLCNFRVPPSLAFFQELLLLEIGFRWSPLLSTLLVLFLIRTSYYCLLIITPIHSNSSFHVILTSDVLIVATFVLYLLNFFLLLFSF